MREPCSDEIILAFNCTGGYINLHMIKLCTHTTACKTGEIISVDYASVIFLVLML